MPVEHAIVSTLAKAAIKRVLALLPSNDRTIAAEITSIWQDTIAEVQAAFESFALEQQRRNAAFAGAFDSTLGKREAVVLVNRLVREAAQSTTRERMQMLAHALAGMFTPDLDTETRSRVSRAVLALEPSDVLELRKALVAEPRVRTVGALVGGPTMSSIAWSPDYEGLRLAGCVADANVQDGGVYVTAVGKAVAGCLQLWQEQGKRGADTSP